MTTLIMVTAEGLWRPRSLRSARRAQANPSEARIRGRGDSDPGYPQVDVGPGLAGRARARREDVACATSKQVMINVSSHLSPYHTTFTLK